MEVKATVHSCKRKEEFQNTLWPLKSNQCLLTFHRVTLLTDIFTATIMRRSDFLTVIRNGFDDIVFLSGILSMTSVVNNTVKIVSITRIKNKQNFTDKLGSKRCAIMDRVRWGRIVSP